jgi:hypothetical protein
MICGKNVFLGHGVVPLEANVVIGIHLRGHPGFEPPKGGENAYGEPRR